MALHLAEVWPEANHCRWTVRGGVYDVTTSIFKTDLQGPHLMHFMMESNLVC